ncbi:hypothetical protein [Plantactinospora sp. WMMB782]|uniref:hypothetical protein n=1 Tax=Plantactinospora sp. WMMB782 TaxID=3404121 RepID=UPI003B93AF26
MVVLTGRAEEHLEVAGRVLHALEAELAAGIGADRLAELRTGLGRLVRQLAGDSPPPLRPLW